jgi:hypothetical protein
MEVNGRSGPSQYFTIPRKGTEAQVLYPTAMDFTLMNGRSGPSQYFTIPREGMEAKHRYFTILQWRLRCPKEFEMVIKSSTLAHTEFYPFGFE